MIEDKGRVAAGPELMLLGRNLAQVLIARRADKRQMAMALDHARWREWREAEVASFPVEVGFARKRSSADGVGESPTLQLA
jgi:hypothetical protein